MLNFFFFISEANIWQSIEKLEFQYEQIKRTIWSNYFRWLFTISHVWEFGRRRNLTFGEQSISLRKCNKHYKLKVPGCIKKITKYQFETVYFICSIDVSMASILTAFINCTSTDVRSMHTVCILFWACTFVTASEQWLPKRNRRTRNILSHIFVSQCSILH